MQGELYGTYRPNEDYFLTLAWKTLKENCKSLSKCGELSDREEKINVKPDLSLQCDSYNEEEEEVNSVFCELNVLRNSSPAEPSDL